MKTGIVRMVLALGCLGLLVAGFFVASTVGSVPQLFRRNAALKAQGYYMGEFEFKLIASQYYLTEGHYLESYRTLRRINAEMTSLAGLSKMPDQATPAEQMAFLLDRQDPVTGAFMDHRYPALTYFAPTCNVVEALAQLAQETGRRLRLKYPLRFLDQIRTAEQLRAYLDALLYVGELSAHFPGPGPYGPGVSELAGFDVLEAAAVHRFSEPWKTELRRWFYDTQDPETGFWGARIGGPGKWRQKTDINATFHIIKLVLTESGESQVTGFPLRYADRLARGVLKTMDTTMPDDTAEQHDWGLTQYQGAKMLAKYLWPRLVDSARNEVRDKFRAMLVESYRLYRPDDGGFAYYAADANADIDGTGLALGVLQALGVMPGTWERERLWGKVSEAGLTATRLRVPSWAQATLPPSPTVQSFRV